MTAPHRPPRRQSNGKALQPALPSRQRFTTGMTGVFSVAAELSARGYIVTTTARNAPGVDVMASTPDYRGVFNIQVKANKPGGAQSFWLLGKEARHIVWPNFFYVMVNLKRQSRSDFYVVPSQEVAQNVRVDQRPKGAWYSYRRTEEYRERWDLLGG